MSEGPRPRNAVAVWWVRLDGAADPEFAERGSLSDAERARAARLAPVERRRFVASRAALRSLLGRHLDCPPAGVRIEIAAAGKPHLPDAPLQFSLAHSHDWAVVALAECAVGVDLERIAPLPEIDSLSNRFLSARERAALAALPVDERLRAFYDCWCDKEAYLKALGCGLSMDPASFTVAVAPAPPALLASPLGERECRRWRLVRLAAPRSYAAALAVDAPRPVLAEYLWQAKDARMPDKP